MSVKHRIDIAILNKMISDKIDKINELSRQVARERNELTLLEDLRHMRDENEKTTKDS